MKSPLEEPLAVSDIKPRARHCLTEGTTEFTNHARDEMRKDDLSDVDVVNVIRAGVAHPGEYRRDGPRQIPSWRYRICTNRICVVVAFESADEMVVVTAWRNES